MGKKEFGGQILLHYWKVMATSVISQNFINLTTSLVRGCINISQYFLSVFGEHTIFKGNPAVKNFCRVALFLPLMLQIGPSFFHFDLSMPIADGFPSYSARTVASSSLFLQSSLLNQKVKDVAFVNLITFSLSSP